MVCPKSLRMVCPKNCENGVPEKCFYGKINCPKNVPVQILGRIPYISFSGAYGARFSGAYGARSSTHLSGTPWSGRVGVMYTAIMISGVLGGRDISCRVLVGARGGFLRGQGATSTSTTSNPGIRFSVCICIITALLVVVLVVLLLVVVLVVVAVVVTVVAVVVVVSS